MSRVPGSAIRWAGERGIVRRRVPSLAFVRRDVARIWPGETIDDALDASIDLHVLGIRTLYTYLPDPPVPPDAAAARATVDEYLALLGRLAAAELGGELTVLPAQLAAVDEPAGADGDGVGRDADPALARLGALAEAAEDNGGWLWLETAGADAVDATLARFRRLRETHRNVGVCLQANLRRTAADVEALLPLDPAIRLVKGTRLVARDAALADEGDVDAAYMALAVTLLRESRARPIRLALATHDTSLVAQIASHAEAAGVGRDRYEIQMRYGVRAKEQRRLARAGFTVQTVVAYGPGWYPWYLDLLADRPSSAVGALRRLLPG